MTLFSGIFGLVTTLHAPQGKHCRDTPSPKVPFLTFRTTFWPDAELAKNGLRQRYRRSSPRFVVHSAPIRKLPNTRGTSRTFISRWPAGVKAGGIRLVPRVFGRSEEHTSELQSHLNLVCRL